MTTTAITDDEPVTKAEHAERVHHLCASAKKLSRRGFVGLYSQDYKAWHQRIDQALTDWERAGS